MVRNALRVAVLLIFAFASGCDEPVTGHDSASPGETVLSLDQATVDPALCDEAADAVRDHLSAYESAMDDLEDVAEDLVDEGEDGSPDLQTAVDEADLVFGELDGLHQALIDACRPAEPDPTPDPDAPDYRINLRALTADVDALTFSFEILNLAGDGAVDGVFDVAFIDATSNQVTSLVSEGFFDITVVGATSIQQIVVQLAESDADAANNTYGVIVENGVVACEFFDPDNELRLFEWALGTCPPSGTVLAE